MELNKRAGISLQFAAKATQGHTRPHKAAQRPAKQHRTLVRRARRKSPTAPPLELKQTPSPTQLASQVIPSRLLSYQSGLCVMLRRLRGITGPIGFMQSGSKFFGGLGLIVIYGGTGKDRQSQGWEDCPTNAFVAISHNPCIAGDHSHD